MVSSLIDKHPGRFAVVTYHINDSFEAPWGKDRFESFYFLPFTPAMMFDGWWNCDNDSVGYATCLGQNLGVSTDVALELDGTQVSGSTWDIGAEVCVESGGAARTMRIYTAATLSNHPDLPSYSRNMLMQSVPTQDVSVSPGSCQTVTQRITFDSESWSNQSDITVIAWAQDPNTAGPAAVHQAAIMGWPFPSASELTTIEISPSSAELDVGESRSFTAIGKDQRGNDFPLSSPVWTMAGAGDGAFEPPSGDSTTQFSAILPGELQVICTDGSVSGAASVVIIGDPPALTEIEILPSSTEMEVGQRKIFAATGVDQYGALFALSNPHWSTTGDGSGIFEPPDGSTIPEFTAMTPGSLQIICSEDGVSGQSSVIITGDPPQLASIAINPETASVVLGSSLVFTATGTDQYGDPFSPDNAQWSVSGEGNGTFDPPSGNATTTFTTTVAGGATVTVGQDGFEASASIGIIDQGPPKPRRIKTRHAPE